jgi:hypothetical protein
MSEMLVESTDRIPADKIAFTLAVATEKAELLSGGVTQRTEVRPVVSREELQKLFDALPRAKAKVVELPDSTSSKPDCFDIRAQAGDQIADLVLTLAFW